MIEILNGIQETVNYPAGTHVMFYRNDETEAYPPHWHLALEIIMPIQNGYNVECNNKFQYPLRENDILLIMPGTLHKLQEQPGKRLIFLYDMSALSSMKNLSGLFSFMQPAMTVTPEAFPAIHGDLVRLMHEVDQEYFGASPLKEAAITAKLLEMLVAIGRGGLIGPEKFKAVAPSQQQKYIERFINLCDHISSHCTEPLTLDGVAELAGFSKYHFSRLFKEFTGTSFLKYLNGRRIEHAERLLLDSDLTVMEVATRSGFNSMSAFMRMFRIVHQCTPNEFRHSRRLTAE